MSKGINFREKGSHSTFDPRPNYFAVLLWTRLMGEEVYATNEEIREGAHVFAHSRKDGKEGKAYLVINNSHDDETEVILPKQAEVYMLSASHIRSTTMMLNGKELVLDENNRLPEMKPVIKEGKLVLPPETATYIII